MNENVYYPSYAIIACFLTFSLIFILLSKNVIKISNKTIHNCFSFISLNNTHFTSNKRIRKKTLLGAFLSCIKQNSAPVEDGLKDSG